jgi:hypothetical protein
MPGRSHCALVKRHKSGGFGASPMRFAVAFSGNRRADQQGSAPGSTCRPPSEKPGSGQSFEASVE